MAAIPTRLPPAALPFVPEDSLMALEICDDKSLRFCNSGKLCDDVSSRIWIGVRILPASELMERWGPAEHSTLSDSSVPTAPTASNESFGLTSSISTRPSDTSPTSNAAAFGRLELALLLGDFPHKVSTPSDLVHHIAWPLLS
jgi:hypothetical protein